ncbi:MAG: hypothetical protein KGO96_05920 [Elusimicrobia bacterium]|nr:hypothetical protein [Elusimicrobiota bacterium]MDE2237916.1 hypothetical protein [Elusimicrobiota bacterium]MDE2425427.1 hypothetical protein [Elusimicrobiota bacterium]
MKKILLAALLAAAVALPRLACAAPASNTLSKSELLQWAHGLTAEVPKPGLVIERLHLTAEVRKVDELISQALKKISQDRLAAAQSLLAEAQADYYAKIKGPYDEQVREAAREYRERMERVPR